MSDSSARISSNREDLVININEKEEKFPLVWLRDNCNCTKCFHFDSHSRLINWNTFQPDVEATSVETENDLLIVTWRDQHKSVYNLNWLKERSFSEESQKAFLNSVYREPKVLWDKDYFANLQKYDYRKLIEDDSEFYKYLIDLAIYGVTIIKNTSKNKDDGLKVVNQIAFPRKTHYGQSFVVAVKPKTTSITYLSEFLQLHTDMPYYEFVPGVIFLHCIEQTKSTGGENLIVDSFYVAEKLRKENKKSFDLLSSIEVNWFDIGQEHGTQFHTMHRSPVITLDSQGNVEQIRLSVSQRDSHFNVNFKDVKPWYKALKLFVDLLNAHSCKFKTNPGEILAIDNRRIVHGRLKYEDSDNNVRYLVGHYVDWDEIYSKIRVMKKFN